VLLASRSNSATATGTIIDLSGVGVAGGRERAAMMARMSGKKLTNRDPSPPSRGARGPLALAPDLDRTIAAAGLLVPAGIGHFDEASIPSRPKNGD